MRAPRTLHRPAGFTLLELLIVVITLGVLAAILMPSPGPSAQQARADSLRRELAALRNAVERYQLEHGGRYPGEYSEADGTSPSTTPAGAAAALVAQLTAHSDALGRTSPTRGGGFKFGPYVAHGAIPPNPFLAGAGAAQVSVDISAMGLTAPPRAGGTSGWKFYLRTGLLVANDGVVLDDGRTRTVDF